MAKEVSEDFRGSPLWQKAHQFVLSIYNFSDYFPLQQAHGLTERLRGAAISIPVSIAESLRSEGMTERSRPLVAARSSLEECRYYLILARDLGYGDSPDLMPQLEEVGRMLKEYGAAVSNF